MFAAANSFFGRTNISQSYNFGPSTTGSRTSTPGPSSTGSSLPIATAYAPPFNVGPWRVQCATHKVTGKRVSVWNTDKKSQDMEKMGPASKERTLEVLKAEVAGSNYVNNVSRLNFAQASALGRLRHPSVLGELCKSPYVWHS